MQKELILKEFEDLKKTSKYLEFSVAKYVSYKIDYIYSSDELEYFDSLSFRFEKTVELTLSFFRGLELYLCSKSGDTIRDRLLIMQKLGFFESIDFWMEARILRNKIAHAYLPEQMSDIYSEIILKSKSIKEAICKIEEYVKGL